MRRGVAPIVSLGPRPPLGSEAGSAPGRQVLPCAQRGVALILVLWLTVLLTVIAAGFAYSMRTEALAARNAVALAQARALADGAISRVAFELMRPRTVAETWASDGAVHYWEEGGATIAANAVDESGKIDLNAASDALLKNLFQTAAGVDADTAARLVDAIGDRSPLVCNCNRRGRRSRRGRQSQQCRRGVGGGVGRRLPDQLRQIELLDHPGSR